MKPITQRGIAIVSAIFILVVLALLGAFAVSLSTTQAIGSAQDVKSALVYQMARAGLEWGLFELNVGAPGVYCSAATTKNMSSSTGDIPAPTLAGITVTVNCTPKSDLSGGSSNPVYWIQSTACTQPNAGACPNTNNPNSMYIERELEVYLQL